MNSFNLYFETNQSDLFTLFDFMADRIERIWGVATPGKITREKETRADAGSNILEILYTPKGIRAQKKDTNGVIASIILPNWSDKILIRRNGSVLLNDIDVERFMRIDKAFDSLVKGWGFEFNSSTGYHEGPTVEKLLDTLTRRHNDIGLHSTIF